MEIQAISSTTITKVPFSFILFYFIYLFISLYINFNHRLITKLKAQFVISNLIDIKYRDSSFMSNNFPLFPHRFVTTNLS